MTDAPFLGAAKAWRVGWTIAAILVVQAVVCGLSAAPVVLFWRWLIEWTGRSGPIRVVAFSVSIVPSYIVFALCLMALSACSTRLTGARTVPDREMRIADMGWPLMTWARYVVAIHVVSVVAGALFKGSPIWTAYLRLNGARIGRRAYVNTTFISDHNLLEFGDDVVIGADVHISGHTVEGGLVKTARVRLGRGVTIGLGSVIDIDVEIGSNTQVGALSLILKHTRLDADTVYAGIPAKRLNATASGPHGRDRSRLT